MDARVYLLKAAYYRFFLPWKKVDIMCNMKFSIFLTFSNAIHSLVKYIYIYLYKYPPGGGGGDH